MEKTAIVPPRKIILLLGDQLSPEMSSLRAGTRDCDIVLMAEVADEASYVPHHKKKIAFLFSAMRHFAQEIEAQGWTVRYISLDEPCNAGSLTGELNRACNDLSTRHVVVTEPGEYRLRAALESWAVHRDANLEMPEDDRFIASHERFRTWASGRKQLRMEYFYREMRRKIGLLMDGDQPSGGKWNFDADNRKPAKADLFMPRPLRFTPHGDTLDVLDLVRDGFAAHFGDLEPFWFAVSKTDAQAALEVFLSDALPLFGDYQDAMITGEPFVYHSVLSLYMNVGLLDPLEVCWRVEAEYRSGRVPINAAEGFIRQIIGWREYVRGIYWHTMPDYVESNALSASRPLPEFYWTGDTKMTCLREAITQTKEEAYAHHIQRLMITGNFAMLAGVDPKQVHEWYLAVYADAFEWVELPNTLGMSQFADGGLLASKPYAASGNYVNKMSDYCRNCAYDVKQKTGPDACPFNALYWDFLARNREHLKGNPRLGPVYRVWDKMAPAKQDDHRNSAKAFLTSLV